MQKSSLIFLASSLALLTELAANGAVVAASAGQDFYLYDANLGTFPGAQGFETLEERIAAPAVVTNGSLHTFRILGDGVQCYQQTNMPIDFTSAPYLLEATLWIHSANHTNLIDRTQRSGYYLFVADDQARHFWIGLSSTGIVINSDVGLRSAQGVTFRPFDTTDDFHTYRFVIDRGTGTLFIDGLEFASLPLGPKGVAQVFPRAGFGDASGLGVSEAELRHFRFGSLAPRLRIEVSEIRLCWNALLGRSYQVQFRSSSSGSSWNDLGAPIPGNGNINCATYPVVEPSRLFRVLLLP